MSGPVLLQGGGEFSPACLPMDAAFVREVGGPVVVTALAGAVGREYETATRNGVRHYAAAAAGVEVLAAPDIREDPAAAVAVLRRARMIVLPGGSPSRLLDALTATAAGDVVLTLLAAGGALSGSSAGAMVLGAWTVLPERPGPEVRPGLGVVPGVLVLPHWSGGRPDWLAAIERGAPDDTLLLGLPEESGVVVRAGVLAAVGVAPTRLLRQGRDLPVGESWELPVTREEPR